MAGTQNIGEGSDNPVAINVTAMVDVIFCLCIFFMCSFHFKQLEGKFETWLPKEKGPDRYTPEIIQLEEIRVFLRWDPGTNRTIRKVGNRGEAGSDEELMAIVREMLQQDRIVGRVDVPVIIDATGDVPWKEVVHVIDLSKLDRIERIEFAAPLEFLGPPSRGGGR